MLKPKLTQYIFLLLLLLGYIIIGYQLQRHETALLLGTYGFLFVIYWRIIVVADADQVNFWIAAAFLFRLTLLFSVPNLSDDFYRFIWDGRLLAAGHHPFAHIPSYYMENTAIHGIDEDLFSKLNSKNYFTIYPPLAQYIFVFSAKLSSSVYGSLLVLKSIIFLSEIGCIVMLKKLLQRFALPQKQTLIYALNPLIILELTGNAHLEGILIFLLLLSLFWISQERYLWAAIALALSICVKLVPLIFLPALLPLLGWKKALLFYIITLITCLLISLPLLDEEIIWGFQNSLGYYFSKFEFNASVYYVVRALGFVFFGFDIIQTAGWKLGLIAGLLILLASVGHWNIVDGRWKIIFTKILPLNKPLTNREVLILVHVMMLSLLIYFLFTTTLHPWYVSTLLTLSVFTNYRFAILWTGTIVLSYAGYSADGFHENLWLVAFEYLTVLGYLSYELLWRRNRALLPC